MATNPYSYGSLGQRWTVGEPTSKSLLDVSRVKADANRWALEQLIVDPDDTANFVLTAPGLNIDSNTLYVDSVYNSVGFRLTNPNDYAFNGTPSWVASGGAGNASVILVSGTTSIGYFAFADGTTGTDRYSGNIQYNHSTNTMSFNTNGGVEAMSIDSSQRVGIGTASPAVPLDVDLAGGSNYIAHFRNQTAGTPYGVHIDEPSSATVDYPLLNVGTVATPRFRVFSGASQTDLTDDGLTINGGGIYQIGSSLKYIASSSVQSISSTNNAGAELTTDAYLWINRSSAPCVFLNRTTTTGQIVVFYSDLTPVGSISVTASATAYNTSSDYRLKENLAPITGAVDRVNALQPRRFNFIAEPDKVVDGFVAHEVSDIVPEAITGEKDAVDADGNPEYQGIDQSKLVPLLTAAIQELTLTTQQLTARIEALEAA